MTMASESSVVLSVQQLLDEEEARQKSALAAREAQLAHEREQQRLVREAEARQAELLARQAREGQQRLESMHQANLLQARILAESEITLARQQSESQQLPARTSPELTSLVRQSSGTQRMVIAGLATLLVGAVLCWSLVIVPGQQRSDQAYVQLRAQHDAVLDEAERRETALRREQQQLRAQLERVPRAVVAPASSTTVPNSYRPVPLPKRIPSNSTRKPACSCLATDPLCDCTP